MSTQNGKTDTSLASMRLVDLLDYVQHTVQLTERPVFSIRDHKNLLCFEHELQGRIGVLHDQQDENGASWLRIERLKRIDPPAVPEKIKVWVTVSRDPNSLPHVAESRIETLSEVDAKACLEQGVISKEDVSEVLKQSKVGSKQVDVFFRLERQPKLRVAIDTYIAEAWQRWADEERPRRETIRVYEQFFNLYHTIHSEGVEHPVEVVWGTGVALGKFDDRTIEQPLIEALVEMEIDEHSGAVCIRPREVPLQLGLSPFYAIDSPGAETVQRNAREFFAKLEREDREFSPFIRETFEPVLRGASQYLQESGVYHPDDIEDATDRTVPAMTSTLKITDTWAIYARRRVDNFIREDLERLKTAVRETKIGDIPASAQRFVTELSETMVINLPGDFRSGGFDQKEAGDDYEEEDLTNANDLYFPKEFNDAQLAITRRLEKSEGVVVQGPPGTGKTHTIANVICHYLATGRRVLVISKGEPALEVLREHIPEEIRDLSISLLASEREGLRQIETAVNRLASTVTSMNPRVVKRDISDKENQRRLLQEKINRIDVEMSEWARQHLSLVENTLVGDLRTLTPVELAERVITDRDLHAWFPDQVGSGLHSELRFTDEDIATVRVARKALGIDLEYNGHTLPSPNDFPDAATLEAIHSDLVNADRVQMEAVVENVPLIYLSVKHAPERAAETLKDLEVMAEYRRAVADQPWLESLFKKWHQTGFNHRSTEMFDNLIKDLAGITEQRKRFLKRPVGLPRLGPHQEAVREAVEKTAQGRRPFGLLPIGRANLRSLFDQITVDGHKPTTQDEWRHISSYLRYQVGITTFVARWNGIAGEFNLPTFSGDTGVTASILAGFHDLVEQAVTILKVLGPKIKQQLAVLFPRGLDASAIILDEAAAIGAAKALQLNLLRHQLSAAQGKVEQIRSRLHEYSGGIVTELEHFVNDVLGRSEVSVSEVSTRWNSLMSELQRLVSLRPHLEHVVHITSLVRESGAPQWAQALATVPVKEIDDPWTPAHWFESWLWTRQIAYLRQIDGRDRLRVLAEQRLGLDKELKRASADLVKLRTHLTLKANMSERVEGALQEFVTHIRKIGSGTGIRSFRHRRDARRAMEKCYAAVPCWIMPAWRASESLPATLGSFDLVIVDEASQSGIEALPALLRGKKLMIVGDDKQVSPTAAFIEEKKLLQLRHNFLNDQPYAALLLPGNSLYDLANAIFPGRRVMLQEHFRCVEPIIRFSFRFYTEPIVPLRIAKASERLDPPLIDVYVPHGSRGKEKINHAEAIAIIDEIERLVNDPAYKGRSIGCVSLIGGDQAQYMQKLLLERIGPAKFLEHRIACGDAPTFQGKERNIMFVSMVARSGHVSAQTSLLFQQRFNDILLGRLSHFV